jgi:signal transduction histidine kinase
MCVLMKEPVFSRIPPLIYFAVIVFLFSCNRDHQQEPDHTRWADSITDHAYDLMNGPSPPGGLAYLDSVYRVTPGRGAGDLWRKYNTIADYYTNQVFDSLKRALAIDRMFLLLKGKEQKYPYEYAHAWYALASFQQSQKKYAQAFQSYYQGRSFAAKNLDNCSLSDFSNKLGVIRYQQGQYLNAIPYLKAATKEISGCKNTSFNYGFILPQAVLNTTALCFEKAGRPDSSIRYYGLALQYVISHETQYPQRQVFVAIACGVIEGNLGGAYAEMHNDAEAERYLKADIAVNDRPGYAIEDAQTAKVKLARLYLSTNKPYQAEPLIQQLGADLASGRGKSAANDDIRARWYELEWRLNEKENRLPAAYAYLERYHMFSDSLERLNSGLKHADMDQAFAAQQQKYQLALWQKNDQLKTAYLVTVLLFLAMMFGISVITWYHFKRSKRYIKTLIRLNAGMKVTMKALEQSQEENTRMMKIVAHDLRNPVGAMTSMAAMLLDDAPRSENDLTLLQLIKASGENSLRLVDELLQVNTPESQLEKAPADLKLLLSYCIDMLEHKALAKNQRIELHAEQLVLNLNQGKMWRVISNLVGNAIKFSPSDSLITVRLEQKGQQVIISVQDEGIGVPVQAGEKIFELFTTAKRQGTQGEESFGLGLGISRQIVNHHGGRIWFEANASVGTTFFISLPADIVIEP